MFQYGSETCYSAERWEHSFTYDWTLSSKKNFNLPLCYLFATCIRVILSLTMSLPHTFDCIPKQLDSGEKSVETDGSLMSLSHSMGSGNFQVGLWLAVLLPLNLSQMQHGCWSQPSKQETNVSLEPKHIGKASRAVWPPQVPWSNHWVSSRISPCKIHIGIGANQIEGRQLWV